MERPAHDAQHQASQTAVCQHLVVCGGTATGFMSWKHV